MLGVGIGPRVRPELALEVLWSRRLVDRLEVYRRLGVREVWVWSRPNRIDVHVRRGDRWVRARRSHVLPSIDLAEMLPFVAREDQPVAVREYREMLRRRLRRRETR